MICRAEQGSIMLNSSDAQAIIPLDRYSLMEKYLNSGQTDVNGGTFLTDLERFGFLSWIRENTDIVRREMARSEHVMPPENAYSAPTILNLELTTRCPLRCPQCYCDLRYGKDLDLNRATEVLTQSAEIGVSYINLSGGETMVYPHLYELLKECSSLGMYAAVALSGYGIDAGTLYKLIDSGVSKIFISLNGSTREISSITRDGHHLAIRALELLAEIGFKNTSVNWVAHQSNIKDFTNVAVLCARMRVKNLVVMAFKPDASHNLRSAPDGEQFLKLAQDIKRMQKELSDLRIEVERCYSPLRAFLGQKFLVNLNIGISKGCGAGRDGVSLNVDGNFTPCRHLDFPEGYSSLRDYWYKSEVLHTLRMVESSPEEPCAACRYRANCLSCLAVNAKLRKRIVKANQRCSLWEQRSDKFGSLSSQTDSQGTGYFTGD